MNVLPRILIIDDVNGRVDPNGRNRQRDDLCKEFDLKDVTDGEGKVQIEGRPTQPIAEAYFYRGQTPIRAVEGDTVVNDLEGCLAEVREGWDSPSESRILEGVANAAKRPFVWALVMLDLAFLTGRVAEKPAGKKEERGIPDGQKSDHDEASYFGLEILEALRREFPKLPVVMFSSMSKTSHLTKKYEAGGAKVFINKKPERFWEYLQEFGLTRDIRQDKLQIVGGSRALLLALREARNSRGDDDAVLIRGERGTGKELFSNFIHRIHQKRNSEPFVPFVTSGLSDTTFASELFGIVGGTYSGVLRTRIGAVGRAERGTLFLDEVADTPMFVQPSLLRLIQEKECEMVGGAETLQSNVRFVAATNVSLEKQVSNGKFREDLLDRLRHGWEVWLPSLKERKEDIPELVREFFKRGGRKVDPNPEVWPDAIPPETISFLLHHDWPGNVRELQSVIKQALRRNRHAEYLLPAHLELPTQRRGSYSGTQGKETVAADSPDETGSARASAVVASGPSSSPAKPPSLDEVLRMVEQFDFESLSKKQLSGQLPKTRKALATHVMRMIKRAFELELEPPLEKHEVVQYTTAIKLLMGGKDAIIKYHRLSGGKETAKANTSTITAKIMNALLSIDEATAERIAEQDPILKKAKKTR
jgi:DNA-binding NtrC family response regulator